MATTTHTETFAGSAQHIREQRACVPGQRLARGLGFFSIGLGLAELLMPRKLGGLIGVRDHTLLTRLMGIREIGAGIAVLMESTPRHSITARVAGDALDLGLLGAAFTSRGAKPGRLAGATAAVAGVTALDVLARVKLAGPIAPTGVIRTIQTIAVNRSPEECYQFWRDFEHLPSFMEHLESVTSQDPTRSTWVAKAPAGRRVEWTAELVQDSPNRIAWRSEPGGDIDTSGSVSFDPAPGNRGTIVRVHLQYSAPGGQAGAIVAKLFGEEPTIQAKTDLRRFKAVLETGEVPTISGQPTGR
jgi:uncharacterized membrane protein